MAATLVFALGTIFGAVTHALRANDEIIPLTPDNELPNIIEKLNLLGTKGWLELDCSHSKASQRQSSLGRTYSSLFGARRKGLGPKMPDRIEELTGGGYNRRKNSSGKWEFFMRNSDQTIFCSNVERVLNNQKPLSQGGSYCTHGGYIATLMRMTETQWWKDGGSRFKDKFLCGNKAKKKYWGANGASELFEKLGRLGAPVISHRSISKRNFASSFNQGHIQQGDTIVLNRRNGSGHGGMFERFETDATGKITGICYWSSNIKTQGYGRQCEAISRISSMNLGGFREL